MNLVHGEKENKMNKLKKIKLGKSELNKAFDSLKLTKEEAEKVMGGYILCSSCVMGPSCTKGWY